VDDNFIGGKRRLKTKPLPVLIERQNNKKGVIFLMEEAVNLADN